MTGQHTINPLANDDLEAVIAIDKKIAGISRRGFFEKRLASTLARPEDYVYVGLRDNGTLAGYALAKLVSGEFGKAGARASLDALGVDPAYRHHGAGHALMAAIEAVLQKKRVSEIASQVGWSESAMLSFFAELGFSLAPRLVLDRDTSPLKVPEEHSDEEDPIEVNYSSPDGDDPSALSTDKVPIRSMTAEDLAAIISIDKKNTGTDRSAYFTRLQYEALHRSGVRVSLIAEMDGYAVGFIMARVDFGEFGRTSSEAVMDAIGVNPGYQGQGVGLALMAKLMNNLAILRVDHVRTEIDWNDFALAAYLDATGFAPAQTVVLSRRLAQ